MRWKRTILSLSLALGLALTPSLAKACGDGYCDDDWGGFYATGGYGFLDFGVDLYNMSSYGGSDYWGGDCGSLLGSCGGGYSSAGLYGSDWGMGNFGFDTSYSFDIDVSLMGLGGYGDLNGLYGSGCDVGCSVGYCDGGVMPFMGGGMGGFPITMTPTASPFIGGLQNFPWSPGAFLNVPPYNNVPPFTQLPPPGNMPIGNLTPPTLPPWGGCDGVIVPCPTGPVTPPVYNPMTNYLPNPGNNYYVPRGGPILPPPSIGIPGIPGGGIDTHNPIDVPIGFPGTGVYTPPSTAIPGGVYSPPGVGTAPVYNGGAIGNPVAPIVYTDPRTGIPNVPTAGGGFTVPGSTIPSGGIYTAPSGIDIVPGAGQNPSVYTGGSNGSPGSPIVYTDPRTGTPILPAGGGAGSIPIVTLPSGGGSNGGNIPITNVPVGVGGPSTAPVYTGGATASPTSPTTYTVPRGGR